MSTFRSILTSRATRAGVAVGIAAVGALAVSSDAMAATQALKLNTATGPASSTTTVLSVTGTGFMDAAGTDLIDTVEFQSTATCTATKGSSGTATATNTVSATSLVVTTPSLATGAASAPKTYQLCVYTTTPALLGAASYTVYAKPTVTARSVTSGPTTGAQTVTLTGTNFTAKSTVLVGSTAATGVKFLTATSLSFVTPKGTAGATNIYVTTEGGKSVAGAGNAYTYVNAITVTPKVGSVDGGTVLNITGAGFDALDFSAGANNAAVMFVPGVYAKATHGVGGTSAATLCTNVQVVSDTQLVCKTPDMGTAGTNDNSYVVTVVADKDKAAATPGNSVVSSGAVFTFASF